jgi:hypothetical protein
MQRVRVFTSAAYGGDLTELERDVNAWLAAQRPQVHQIAQSTVGEHVVLTVLYAEGAGAAHREEAASVEVPEVFERTLEGAELDPGDAPDLPLPELELPY